MKDNLKEKTMGKHLGDLPSHVKAPRKQVTIGGVKVIVSGKIWYGSVIGWNITIIYPDGIIKEKFHNGAGFNNPQSIDEAMEYALTLVKK